MIKENKAFSLTELLIVIVIIAVLFAALAPIITKRHVSETHQSESIWNFVTGDTERNAYFDPGDPSWTSSVYMGTTAPTVANNKAGKLVINSGNVSYNGKSNVLEPQIQFRFSQDTKQQGKGLDSANLLLANKSLLFGSYFPFQNSAGGSTIYGFTNSSPSSPSSAVSLSRPVTIMGANAAGNSSGILSNKSSNYLIAVGNRAAEKIGDGGYKDIFIGSGAGIGAAGSSTVPENTIAIGYNTMAYVDNLNKENKNEIHGSNNLFVGAYTGNGFISSGASNNTIVASTFAGSTAANNTIIGYGVYTDGDPTVSNMTAIGYNSCNSMSGLNKKVCIGSYSGYSTNNTPNVFNTDSGEHIFLGGTPLNPVVWLDSNNAPITKPRPFSGRGMLEVHNNGTEGNVVLNSNLVVRGNFYPSNENGVVSYNDFRDTMAVNAETPYYICNSDSYQEIINYNNYICKGFMQAAPKSVNLLYRVGSCASSDGYPTGSPCPRILSSDIRLKTDISDNDDGLDKILRLSLYNYTYKDKPNEPRVGVIAQDLQKIFPDAVSADNNGYLQIRFEDMFYALINSIKQLAAKIDVIAAKILNLKNDILFVQSDQKYIKKQISVIDARIRKFERE